MMRLLKFTFNAFQENTYILYDDKNQGTIQGVIIDPGMSNPERMGRGNGGPRGPFY